MSELPWWMNRCTHREHQYELDDNTEYGCWRVLKEAEGVVVLHLQCRNLVHICVDHAGVGSMCKTLTFEQYFKLSNPEELKLVQGMFRELKSL